MIGMEIIEYMIKGKALPESLIIKSLITKIKSHFDIKTEEQILEDHEIEKRKHQNSIVQEEIIPSSLTRIKSAESKLSRQTEVKELHINKKTSYYSKGFVIIGFPNNYEQVLYLLFNINSSKG